jgi:multisubunit Na+/H+ antiporter MnhB subunit
MSPSSSTGGTVPRDGEPGDAMLRDDGSRDGPPGARWALAAVLAAGGAALGGLVLGAGDRPPLLPTLVAERIGEAGVSNPVTAVLLNFRAYDTLLEVAVLLAAMVAVWSLDRGNRKLGRGVDEQLHDPVVLALARLVVPLAGVTAVYLVWAGSHRPGGAFQAGALLAGAGVLLVVAGLVRPPTAAARSVRVLAALGVYVFVAVGVAVIPWTGRFLEYPDGWAYGLILLVESVLTLTIAAVLVELFVDVPSLPDPDPALVHLDPTGDPLGRVLELIPASREPDEVEDP